MNKVIFTSCEKGDDIIISLCCDEDSEFGNDGFIIIRTPKCEFILSQNERGAHIAWEEDDIIVLLDKVTINRNKIEIKTRGKVQKHSFDITKITDNEYKDLLKHFYIINFDNTFDLIIDD